MYDNEAKRKSLPPQQSIKNMRFSKGSYSNLKNIVPRQQKTHLSISRLKRSDNFNLSFCSRNTNQSFLRGSNFENMGSQVEVRNDQEPDKRSRFDLLLTKKLFAAFKRICEFLDLGSLEQFESCCVQAKTGDDTWKTALDIEKQKRLVEPIDLQSWLLYLHKKISLGKNPAKETLTYSVAKNLKIDEETHRVIEADSKRTFNSSLNKDKTKIRLLKDCLIAISTQVPGGYFQGMNSIVGILFNFDIEPKKIFKISLFLLKKIKLSKLYQENFQKTYELVAKAKEIIKKNMPALNLKFEEFGIKLDVVILRWILTAFTDFLSPAEFLSLSVNLIEHGIDYLCCLCFSYINELKDKIFDSKQEETIYRLLQETYSLEAPDLLPNKNKFKDTFFSKASILLYEAEIYMVSPKNSTKKKPAKNFFFLGDDISKSRRFKFENGVIRQVNSEAPQGKSRDSYKKLNNIISNNRLNSFSLRNNRKKSRSISNKISVTKTKKKRSVKKEVADQPSPMSEFDAVKRMASQSKSKVPKISNFSKISHSNFPNKIDSASPMKLTKGSKMSREDEFLNIKDLDDFCSSKNDHRPLFSNRSFMEHNSGSYQSTNTKKNLNENFFEKKINVGSLNKSHKLAGLADGSVQLPLSDRRNQRTKEEKKYQTGGHLRQKSTNIYMSNIAPSLSINPNIIKPNTLYQEKKNFSQIPKNYMTETGPSRPNRDLYYLTRDPQYQKQNFQARLFQYKRAQKSNKSQNPQPRIHQQNQRYYYNSDSIAKSSSNTAPKKDISFYIRKSNKFINNFHQNYHPQHKNHPIPFTRNPTNLHKSSFTDVNKTQEAISVSFTNYKKVQNFENRVTKTTKKTSQIPDRPVKNYCEVNKISLLSRRLKNKSKRPRRETRGNPLSFNYFSKKR